MFERYSQSARRCIFFARHAAIELGTDSITAEELLLGILREHHGLAVNLAADAATAIQQAIRARADPAAERIPASVDLPIHSQVKAALTFATEEADRLQHEEIDVPHLVLGLLRVNDCYAAELLRQHGVNYERYREGVADYPAIVTLDGLRKVVDETARRLPRSSDHGDEQLYTGGPWTKKEALGHLIDYATTHHQWLSTAVADGHLTATGYPDKAAVAVQDYAEFPWPDALDLWVALNRLLLHALSGVPKDKLRVMCRIGSAEPVSLGKLMKAYVEFTKNMTRRILAPLAVGDATERKGVERATERPAAWAESRVAATAALLDPSIRALQDLLDSTVSRVSGNPEPYGGERLKRTNWTRKEALGHLIDYAIAHQQWLVQALMDTKVTAAGYPDETTVSIRNYGQYSWLAIVDLWVLLNRLLIHVLSRVPEDKLDVPCRIGIADPVQLLQSIEQYVAYCQDIARQVVAHV